MKTTKDYEDDSLRWKVEPQKTCKERAVLNGGIDPVMIRAYHAENKGATAFFRNRPFLDVLIDLLSRISGDHCRVLFHASSVGAEPYSFALRYFHGAHSFRNMEIYATDINNKFIDVAKKGEYSSDILQGMTEEERSWFICDGDMVRIPDAVKELVHFLPAMSFVDGNPGLLFDAVLVMNAFTYVSPDQQKDAIRKISTYARDVIAATAFHPDTIKHDMNDVGFVPYIQHQEAIHSAWGDRITDKPIDPTLPEYSWRLPRFNNNVLDYEYRFSSLFLRKT